MDLPGVRILVEIAGERSRLGFWSRKLVGEYEHPGCGHRIIEMICLKDETRKSIAVKYFDGN